MKIEKISDNQIRCILTADDLAKRQLKLSELAYGSDKAKRLFRDMMQQAAFQYGFEAENIPLMIEAVPLSAGSIAVIVTKVDNPEELDTRFSSFAPSVGREKAPEESGTAGVFEQLLSAIRSVSGGEKPAAQSGENTEDAQVSRMKRYFFTHRLYLFSDMEHAILAAKAAAGRYDGESSLYYDSAAEKYALCLEMRDVESVGKQLAVLSAISEFGETSKFSLAREEHLREHCRTILADHALESLKGQHSLSFFRVFSLINLIGHISVQCPAVVAFQALRCYI